jgi:subfamily B ATP-binding cassette protein MsbA
MSLSGEVKGFKSKGLGAALRLLSWAKRYTLLIVVTALAMMGLAGLDAGRVTLLRPLLDEVPRSDNWDRLRQIAYIALGLTFLIFVLKYITVYLSNYLVEKILKDIRDDTTGHLFYLPLSIFHKRRSGDILSRIINDVNILRMPLSFLFEQTLLHPLRVLAAIGLIFWVSWKLGLVAFIFFPIYIFTVQKIGKRLRKTRRQSLERLGDVTDSIVQVYSGIKIVKAFNREQDEVTSFKARNQRFFSKLLSAVKKRALSESLVNLFLGFSIVILLMLGGYFAIHSKLTPGDMTVFAVAIAMINMSVKELTKGYNKLQESVAACERVFELLDLPVQNDWAKEGSKLKQITKGIEYRDVWFAYDTDPVLKEISFKARVGEVVAIVGRSGAGKSTLLDLLCRFYELTRGSIFIDGKDIREISRRELLKHIGIVTQEPFLFHTTIAENIRYGDKGASMARVIEAAKAAQIHDFILTLKDRYETVVGERGATLSGGQRQRIAIARAIIKNPSILILDEATSALDLESERLVQSALNELLEGSKGPGKGRITFIIAHRLSSVINADKILVLDEGKIAGMGKHAQLLKSCDVYANLYKDELNQGTPV